MKGKARPVETGFTLLEVLVATTIMAIAVTGLLSALSNSLHNASRLTEYDRSVLLARQKMDELLIATTAPIGVPFEGVWDPALSGGVPSGWKAIITPYEVPPAAAPGSYFLERVQLEVWWDNGGDRRKTFSLEGYRQDKLKPNEAPPTGIAAP